MLKPYLLTVLISVGVITLAGGIYLTSSNNNQTIAGTNGNTVLASVWDQATESYSGNKDITVYRSPSCGCCGLWIEHMQKHGFQVNEIKTDNMEAIKKQYNLPSNLASCHTAIIDGYVMEGHIPGDDIKRFLKQKPDATGLTVPAMSLGTPGMEAGERKQPFAVLAFDDGGTVKVFKQYETY